MAIFRIAAILLACVCVVFGAPSPPRETKTAAEIVPSADDGEDYRLPTTITPVNYNITLTPYLLESDGDKRFTFDGTAEIEITTSITTNIIVLHAKNLNILTKSYKTKGTVTSGTLTTSINNTVTDKVTFTTSGNLVTTQSYILTFTFTGRMDDDMKGFYRSSYVDSKNNTKWLGTTQFQINHARRAFPSFDEPKFKATFDITIVRHKSMKSASNTRLKSSTYDGNYVTDVYEQTPKMSTYLVAFIVSEFNERYDGDFGIIARPEYYAQTEYSHEMGQKILSALSNYFNLDYYSMGINKMHMAAIPDFSAGAMENWGLLTYRERYLLYDETTSTLSSKQSISTIIAHEQAHMWFGDRVTCEWWSYAWLNEGFASYFEYFGTALVMEELKLEQQFVLDQLQSVMYMDSTNSTNPMSDEDTNSPADLSRMFNSITYYKGGSFIRMVNHVMGEDNFKKSLQTYQATYQNTNTVPKNLFDIWKANWPSTFSTYADSLFSTYTEQVGYPLVTINVSNDSFTISQNRFLLNSGDGSNASLLYTVPITYTTSEEKDFISTTPKLFLEAKTDTQTVKLSKTISWLIANIQETGYYRVNYDENNWKKIGEALADTNWTGIHELNRAQIVDDLLNLARSGVTDYNLTLSVLEYLDTETNYLPWLAAFNGYSYLSIRLGTDTADFGDYLRQLMDKVYNLLGFEERSSDTTLDIYNRVNVLAWSCRYGNSDCVTKAKNYFKNMDSTPIPVNIRSVVYCVSMREGSESDYDTLFGKYKNSTVPTEETLILFNLGCVKDSALIKKHFWNIVGDSVRLQDKTSALSYLYSQNNANVDPVFDLVTENYQALADSLGSYSSVASVISNIASRFTESSQKTKLVDFNNKNKASFGSAASTLEAAENTVDANLDWASKRLGSFKQYLDDRSSSASLSAFTMLTLLMAGLLMMLFH